MSNHNYVIFGTESWLQPAILSSDVFPDNYVAYHKNWGSLGGRVFNCVHKNLVSTAQQSKQRYHLGEDPPQREQRSSGMLLHATQISSGPNGT